MRREREKMQGLRGLGDLQFIYRGERREKKPMNKKEFRDALIGIMEQKTHWADFAFPEFVETAKMRYHFRDEYAVFVKPFPHYLQGVLGQLPPKIKGTQDKFRKIRKDLKENIEEEEYGHIAQRILSEKYGHPVPARSHADLFLDIPRDPAFGFDVRDFDTAVLGPRAEAYRSFLEDATHNRGWEVGAAVSTLFLEGNKRERSVFHKEFGIKPWLGLPLEQHPLHVHKKVQLRSLGLIEAHHELDSAVGSHRKAAWSMILKGIPKERRAEVLQAMQDTLRYWQEWRTEVAEHCGVERRTDDRGQ
ncbi:iron-containing redox enzyme family protein [Patescibacteria group bacterium]|nr:iron-containing redox enzyme family protein [Patescibacteria group bacterium]